MKRLLTHLTGSMPHSHGLSEAVGFFEETCAELWEERGASPTGVCVRSSPKGRLYAFKLGRGGRMKRLLRSGSKPSSRSRRALAIGDHLVKAGVPTPQVYACLEERFGPIVCRDALVMEFVEAPTLGEALGTAPPVPAGSAESTREPASTEEWARAAAETIHSMHSAQVRHRDLKASNLLALDGEKDGRGKQVFLIDLDGARRLPRSPSFEVRVRDLSRLAVSFAVLGWTQRIEEAYAEIAGWSAQEVDRARVLMSDYEKAKRAANSRRGRELT